MITVLLASYQGNNYIAEQVRSIADQTIRHNQPHAVRLIISDDFSAEATTRLLAEQGGALNISVIQGPGLGVRANFLHLIKNATKGLTPEPAQSKSSASSQLAAFAPTSTPLLFAFADQDDVWLPEKLATAQTALATLDTNQAALYAGVTQVVDTHLNPLFLSKNKPRPADFKNALLESIAGGNTMVFNYKTLELLQKIEHPVHHDWLVYMLVTACGGKVIFDNTPYVLYRQHEANVIGANKGLKQKLFRLKKLFSGEFKTWSEQNIKVLAKIQNEMTPKNKETFAYFVKIHQLNGWKNCFTRLILFKKSGLYRQRKSDHYGFMLAAFFGLF